MKKTKNGYDSSAWVRSENLKRKWAITTLVIGALFSFLSGSATAAIIWLNPYGWLGQHIPNIPIGWWP